MEDILSDQALNTIRDRYYAGVTAAELGFENNEGDEDSLTGGLGQALLTPPTIVRNPDGSEFAYLISHYKIRGRGINAPEKKIGADGIFQIQVSDRNEKIIRQKGLLFQSKKRWTGKDALLGSQAAKFAEPSIKGIVIDFSPNGYSACAASVAADTQGSRRKINSERFSRLATALGDEFLRCKIGIVGLYYDPTHERLIDPTSDEPGTHVIDTRVQRLSERAR